MGVHPPHQDAKVLAVATTFGEDGEAPHDSFLDLGATHFLCWLTLGVGAHTFTAGLAGLSARLYAFTVIEAFLVPIACLDPLLVGFALLVGPEAFTVILTDLDFLAGLGPRLCGFTVGIRIPRLARGLPNLIPGTFLRLSHHHIGVLRTVSGF